MHWIFTLNLKYQKHHWEDRSSGVPFFLHECLERNMLTILIEAEGKVTCINSNRDGPHSRHGFHKGVLALWDSHKTCVISGRILRTVSAGSLLLKVKRKRLDYCHPPPGNMGSTHSTQHFTVKVSNQWCCNPGIQILLEDLKLNIDWLIFNETLKVFLPRLSQWRNLYPMWNVCTVSW
jgi:hypothetical protein